MQNIQEIKTKKLTWINITNSNKDNIKYLKNEFGFDPLDLSQSLPSMQRPKIHDHKDYIFIILQFPFYDKDMRTIEAAEIDMFVKKKYLITSHTGELTPLVDMFNMYLNDQLARIQLEKEDLPGLIYKIFHKLYNYCYPILNDIDNDISEAEKGVLDHSAKKTIEHILLTKRNIVDYEKIMQSHARIWEKFWEFASKFKFDLKTSNYFRNLMDYSNDIWDYLKNYKDTISALHETQEAMTSFKTNQIMKTLTIFSVVVFPLTLLAAIFGMNTMNSMPFVNNKYDFWYIIGIMFVGMIIMFWFFKRKKWL